MSRSRHTLVVQVEDQPGVLNRVVSLMRRRSFNIDSITVGHSEIPGVSRMTIVVNGESPAVEQVGKQLYKLMEVLKVTDLDDASCVARELALIKVAAKAAQRSEILQIAEIYGARVVDASPSTIVLEMTGSEEKIDALLTMLRGFGIRELVRSGRIAMVRGASTVTAKPATATSPSAGANGNANGNGHSGNGRSATIAADIVAIAK